MTDYSKQTVAQLRQLLKDRGIPSTGLTRKAQIIEKLEEADNEVGGAQEERVDAPADPVKRIEDEGKVNAGASEAAQEDAPGPTLSTAGAEQAPLPVASTDPQRETVSHIDSGIPPPDPIKAVEIPAEDSTVEKEAGAIQPAKVFNAPPADPEAIVGPRITEPTDAEVDGEKQEELAENELPDAPGPAAEALRFAQQKPGLPKDLQDDATADRTSSPIINEQPSVEKPELLAIPERSTAETSRLNTEELEADSKKRKRRSDTPDLPLEDIKAKKHRPSQEPAPEVYLEEDSDVVMEQIKPEDSHAHNHVRVVLNGEHASPVGQALPLAGIDAKHGKKENVARYKDLVDAGPDDVPVGGFTDERPTVPALHPVTAALYIRNLMRPLRPESLRAHLTSLAAPPSSSTDSTIVQTLFLDAMKTHALVIFNTTTAASRVRATLHGSIWPPEGNRKELWVDFVPDEQVADWISEEEDAVKAEKEARANGRSLAPKRFEVVYSESSDGTITAVFQEVGSNAPINAPRGPRASLDVRRPSTQQPLAPTAPSKDVRQDIEASFKTLDELFSSTTAKPQLFYLPVSDEISELRLKELDNETSRDWTPGETKKGRGIQMEMKYKYSFDDQDRIVESGEDRGPWSESYRGGRGGFRGRGRGGGGYRGRGDTWRG